MTHLLNGATIALADPMKWSFLSMSRALRVFNGIGGTNPYAEPDNFKYFSVTEVPFSKS